MAYVAMKRCGKILFRKDAFACKPQEAQKWAIEHGFKIVEEEVTFMGNMIVWVE